MAPTSITPLMSLLQLAENQARLESDRKAKSVKLNAEAKRKVETVTRPDKAAPDPKTPEERPKHIDRRM